MKIKIKHPIIYDGTVLQRGREYETDKFKIAEKHINSWIQKRLVEKVEEVPETKVDVPEETKEESKEDETEFTYEELEAKTVAELKEMAKKRKIKKYYDMKQDELIKAILGE